MNQQEFIDQVTNGPLSENSKQIILSLINTKGFDFEVREEIKTIIQTEIDADFKDLLEGETDEAETGLVKEMEDGMQKVEDILKNDMAYVEKEMDDLKNMVQELDKAMDEAQIADLKSQIQ